MGRAPGPRGSTQRTWAGIIVIDSVKAALDTIDARSRRVPWIREVLRLIEEHPGLRALDLAEHLGRDKLPFKADVRRLKALGLTERLETGYRLSPRGKALMAYLWPLTE